MMRERPILFSAPMVRAILAGQKTQTRRVAKEFASRDGLDAILRRFPNQNGCPFGQAGDRLWVREAWGLKAPFDDTDWYRGRVEKQGSEHPIQWSIEYRASYGPCRESCHWRPSIHMPRWASRILLEIVSVRVQRLQDISEDDAYAEGVTHAEQGGINAREGFAALWDKINGAGSWANNPWVWVVEFRRVDHA